MLKILSKKIFLFFFFFFLASPLVAKEKPIKGQTYTINFSNISLLEYVRFVGQITETNFVFNESDLNFTISVLSEEPITKDNVMATLIQIMRMHNLSLLEDGNNLVIQQGNTLRQLGAIVPEKMELDTSVPISTKLFRIKNANVSSVANVIRPLISPQALMEVSLETRQLIITDITQNIERISELIQNLDSTTSPLVIESYKIKYGDITTLVEKIQKIVAPLTNSNPYIVVPQETVNTIYFVSTPQLIEKSLSILGKLDVKSTHVPKKVLTPENIFIYKPLYLSPDKFEDSLDDLKDTLEAQGHSSVGLIDTLETMEYIKETGSFLFSGDQPTIAKLQEILATLDSPGKGHEDIASNSFFTYKPLFKTPKEVKTSIVEITKTLESEKGYANKSLINTLNSAKIVDTTKSILFTGNPQSFGQIQELLQTIDHGRSDSNTTFLIYEIKNTTPSLLEKSLREMAKNLDATNSEDQAVKQTIEEMKFLKDSDSLIFNGSPYTLEKIKEIATNFDRVSLKDLSQGQTYIVYQIKNASYTSISNSLQEMRKYLDSSKIEDKQLIEALNTMKFIPDTNSLAYSGTQETLVRLQKLLDLLDRTDSHEVSDKYFIYQPQYVPGKILEKQILSTEQHLKASKLANPIFLRALHTVRWDSEANALFFIGDQQALDQVQSLLTKIDSPESAEAIGSQLNYYIYTLLNVRQKTMDEYLNRVLSNLKKIETRTSKENQLINTIESRQWVEESNSFMFYGSKDSIDDITPLVSKFDVIENEKKPSYYLYSLEHAPAESVEDNLHEFAKKLKGNSEIKNSHKKLIQLIDNIRLIKETNSLMLTGDPETLDEAKKLIVNYDIPNIDQKRSDNFFIYNPKYLTLEKLDNYIKQTLAGLKEAGLSDPALIRSVTEMQINPQTNAVIFTGSQPTIARVKELLSEIDNQALATLDDTTSTFFIYKLQKASGPEVINSLQGVAKDLSSLSQQSPEDKEFLKTLNSVKYIEKTNSLLFTGTTAALSRARALLSNFDVPQLSGPGPQQAETFFVYRPKNLPGPEIKVIMEAFGQKLKTSGVSDQALFHTLDNIQWTAQTNSLVFTGTEQSLARTQELLKTFDVHTSTLQPDALAPIQDIDDTSFLVYKLQFHKGEEIQLALRAVARDLLKAGSKVNIELLNSISSIQLIPMTNSLLCSGSPDTLKRLKELIRNLDIPLKQVFIEMLVVETNYNNVLNFGLGWAGKVDYRGRTVGAVNNIAPGQASNPFFQNANNKSATNPPVGTDVPFSDGFDLGVIGDIIKHKGNTFVSLASLVSALETDQDSTIVMTPKLITQDSKTSEIFIGQNIPFIGSFVSNESQNTVQTQNLEYRDIGVNLVLTPVLGNSDIVTLRLQMSRTVAATDANGDVSQTSIGNVTGITTSKTTMNTTVHIPNKNFLVLSGMVQSTKVRSKSGVPCLGGLPIIGAAFSQNDITDVNRNIVIFMRPHIITSYEDMLKLTESQEDFFKDNSGSFELEKDFEEAMEMIKSDEDD